jgi:hypothetical protein
MSNQRDTGDKCTKLRRREQYCSEMHRVADQYHAVRAPVGSGDSESITV